MSVTRKPSFIYRNSLSIAFLILAVLTLLGQVYNGMDQYNDYLKEHGIHAVSLAQYLKSGHFLQATFENWESEFFQMALFVWLTVFLRQKGSSESKGLSGKEEVDRVPKNILGLLGQ